MPTIIGGRMSPTMKPGAAKHLTGVFSDDYSKSINIGTEFRRNPGNGSNKDPYPLAHGKQFEVPAGVGSRVNPCKTIGGKTTYVTVGDQYDKFGNRDTYELAHGKQFATAPEGGGYTGTIDNPISPAKYNAVGDPYKGSASESLRRARGAGKGLEVPRAGPSKVNLDKTIGGNTSFITVGDQYDKLGNKDSYDLAHGKQFLGGGSKSPNRASGADQDAVFEARYMQLFAGEKYRDEHKQDYTDYRVCQRLTETVKKDRRVMERKLQPQYVAAQGLPTLSLSVRPPFLPLTHPFIYPGRLPLAAISRRARGCLACDLTPLCPRARGSDLLHAAQLLPAAVAVSGEAA
jgi:hypothetical protein